MDIRTMKQRENFYEIFCETLSDYFQDRFHIRTAITIKGRLIGEFQCYERLNIITRRIPSRETLRYGLGQYNIRGSDLKRMAAKALVTIELHSFGLLGNNSFSTDHPELLENAMIWPCNRSIRIFDFHEHSVVSIKKKGFPDTYFRNSIEFRKQMNYNFLPPLTCYGGNWFEEPILDGKALARVSDRNLYQKAESDCIADLQLLYNDTETLIPIGDYCKHLVSEIETLSIMARKQKNIQSSNLVEKMTKYAVGILSNMDHSKPICTVLSHGDLQSGNIWVDEASFKAYLIDWETCRRRSRWYDIATLKCGLRRVNGWKHLLESFDTISDLIKDRQPYSDQEKSAIVLLEDIVFCLNDLMSLPSGFGKDHFDRKTQEACVLNID